MIPNCRGCEIEKEVFEQKLKELESSGIKGNIGFIEKKIYTTSSGKIIIETELILGYPSQRFRESIQKAGLINFNF